MPTYSKKQTENQVWISIPQTTRAFHSKETYSQTKNRVSHCSYTNYNVATKKIQTH